MAGYTIRASLAKARRLFRRGDAAIKTLVFLPGPLATRPRLIAGLALGLIAALALFGLPNPLKITTRAILAWDVGCSVFIGATLLAMRDCRFEVMRARAEVQDEGAVAILLLSLVAAAASIGAIVLELSQAKGGHGLLNGLRMTLAFITVALSWMFVQVVFALHYAHEYFAPAEGDPSACRQGLNFPGTPNPDYWDFLHFSIVLGAAAQTADISFTSQTLRHIGTLHSMVAFVFNTAVLALTINLAAGLF